MKKVFALLLALVMVLGALVACSGKKEEAKTADTEGELVVYGSCEEDYLAAACKKFEELYGIKTTYQRMSTGEVPAKIAEEKGKPSADVWFGGTNNPYDQAAADGLLDGRPAQARVQGPHLAVQLQHRRHPQAGRQPDDPAQGQGSGHPVSGGPR